MIGQAINVILGLWLMAAPAVLSYGGAAATSDRIVGPIAATAACIAMWEVTRPLRWTNVPLGLWMLIAPMLLDYERAAAVNSLAVGVLLILFSFVRGNVHTQFGGGWRSLWSSRVPTEGYAARGGSKESSSHA